MTVVSTGMRKLCIPELCHIRLHVCGFIYIPQVSHKYINLPPRICGSVVVKFIVVFEQKVSNSHLLLLPTVGSKAKSVSIQ